MSRSMVARIILPRVPASNSLRSSLSVSQGIVAAARRRAQEIIDGATKDAADRAAAAEESGRAQAFAEISARYLSGTETYREILRSATTAIQTIVSEIAKAVIQTELRTHPESILSRIEHALSLVQKPAAVVIRVHSTHAALLRETLTNLTTEHSDRLPLTVLQDDTLAPADAVLETPFGEIISSIESHLKTILDYFSHTEVFRPYETRR